MKPILFNTDMVRAILEGRKTVTRRVVRPQPPDNDPHNVCFNYIENGTAKFGLRNRAPHFVKLPYQPGNILYVRETWSPIYVRPKRYVYKADADAGVGEVAGLPIRWRPSIHMPKQAARIFLRVTDVRVERLQDITPEQIDAEGFKEYGYSAETGELMPSGPSFFMIGWNKTIKPKDRTTYEWDANPWVWVIEFERSSRGEAQTEKG